MFTQAIIFSGAERISTPPPYKYVIVRFGVGPTGGVGATLVSNDFTNWTEQPYLPTGATGYSYPSKIYWFGSFYLAVGAGVAYSINGTNWTPVPGSSGRVYTGAIQYRGMIYLIGGAVVPGTTSTEFILSKTYDGTSVLHYGGGGSSTSGATIFNNDLWIGPGFRTINGDTQYPWNSYQLITGNYGCNFTGINSGLYCTNVTGFDNTLRISRFTPTQPQKWQTVYSKPFTVEQFIGFTSSPTRMVAWTDTRTVTTTDGNTWFEVFVPDHPTLPSLLDTIQWSGARWIAYRDLSPGFWTSPDALVYSPYTIAGYPNARPMAIFAQE